jgi:hypothetical protein
MSSIQGEHLARVETRIRAEQRKHCRSAYHGQWSPIGQMWRSMEATTVALQTTTALDHFP